MKFFVKAVDKTQNMSDFISMTDFLFARPSVLEGIGRAFDFFGSLNYYNLSPTGKSADAAAAAADWFTVYNDFYTAYKDTLCQLETKKTAV